MYVYTDTDASLDSSRLPSFQKRPKRPFAYSEKCTEFG